MLKQHYSCSVELNAKNGHPGPPPYYFCKWTRLDSHVLPSVCKSYMYPWGWLYCKGHSLYRYGKGLTNLRESLLHSRVVIHPLYFDDLKRNGLCMNCLGSEHFVKMENKPPDVRNVRNHTISYCTLLQSINNWLHLQHSLRPYIHVMSVAIYEVVTGF